MRLLITGTHGYIGGALMRHYGEDVVPFSLRHHPIASIAWEGITHVVHAAGAVHHRYSDEAYTALNTRYPIDLAHAAKAHGVRYFILLSTIAIYDPHLSRIDENTLPHPSTPYGKSKYEGEKGVMALAGEGFDVMIVRIPMVYGEGAPGNGGMLARLIRRSCLLPLRGITNQRTFVSLDNLIALLEHLITHPHTGVLLAGDDTPMSTSEFAHLLVQGCGCRRVWISGAWIRWIAPSIYHKLYGDLIVDGRAGLERIGFVNPLSSAEALERWGRYLRRTHP